MLFNVSRMFIKNSSVKVSVFANSVFRKLFISSHPFIPNISCMVCSSSKFASFRRANESPSSPVCFFVSSRLVLSSAIARPNFMPCIAPCLPNTDCITCPAAWLLLLVPSIASDTLCRASNTVMLPSSILRVISAPSIPSCASASLVCLVIKRIFLMPIRIAFMFWSENKPPSELWMMATS